MFTSTPSRAIAARLPVAPPMATVGTSDPVVWYTLGGVELPSLIPPGRDRWDAVAEAVGERLRVQARAEDPPTYDTGTRNWTLVLTVTGKRRRAEQMLVPVRWH